MRCHRRHSSRAQYNNIYLQAQESNSQADIGGDRRDANEDGSNETAQSENVEEGFSAEEYVQTLKVSLHTATKLQHVCIALCSSVKYLSAAHPRGLPRNEKI